MMKHDCVDIHTVVEVQRELPFTTQQVWSVLGDFGNHTWVPSVRRAELIGQGIGAIRRLCTDAGVVDERLDAWDDARQSFAYSVVSVMPYPVEDYRVRVQIESVSHSTSLVQWCAEFRVLGIAPVEAGDMMQAVYRSIGDWLMQELERRFSAPA